MTLIELPTIRRPSPSTLVDALLVEQQSLTAVERFARLHEAGQEAPDHAQFYRDLLPLTAPQPDEQYAFVVDLDACSGCKACVTACHSLNGLDESETFRDVGGIAGRDQSGLHVLQHVTTACHHCLEPACLTGCPTQAYDKDPVTGIVRHLDDQCIGCQYCTLMCPYGVPKYNPARGIVRKCDMCRQRLDDGEAPACVQACPNQAIRIEVVRREVVAERAAKHEFLPASPDPRLTLPTTRYIGRRELRDVAPIDGNHDRPAQAHLPLVFMLVLTQMSVGMFLATVALSLAGLQAHWIATVAAIVGIGGLSLSILHLGRPQIAWRAWLGWRTSWMSREILAFGLFALLAVAYVVAVWIPGLPYAHAAGAWLGLATCASGLIGVFCSAMIYVATGREFWSLRRSVPRFFVTVLILGIAATATILSLAGTKPGPGAPLFDVALSSPGPGLIPAIWFAGALIAATLVRFIADHAAIHSAASRESEVVSRSTDLLTGPLNHWHVGQVTAAVIGGVIIPLLILGGPQLSSGLFPVAAVLLVASELVHRGLFFAAVVAPRMPGVNQA